MPTREFANFGDLITTAHSDAIVIGKGKVEHYSKKREGSLAKKVASNVGDGIGFETRIKDLDPERQIQILSGSYALAMQLFLQKSKRKTEPQRRPELVLSDQDAYCAISHRIFMNRDERPGTVFPTMVEETAHSVRARLVFPSEDEPLLHYLTATEFCGMVARRKAYECMSDSTADRLGHDAEWLKSDNAVEQELLHLEQKARFASLCRKDLIALRYKMNSLIAHQLGYTAGQRAFRGIDRPLDEVFAMPSKAIIDTYIRTHMAGSRILMRLDTPQDPIEI